METRTGAREEISLAYENRKQTVKGRAWCSDFPPFYYFVTAISVFFVFARSLSRLSHSSLFSFFSFTHFLLFPLDKRIFLHYNANER